MRHFHRRAFAQVVDIRLECQAEAGNFHFRRTLIGCCQTVSHCGFHTINHPQRFSVIHQARGMNQTRLLRILRDNKPRIDRNTVAADAGTRLQNIDPRMAIRQADKLPDIDALIGTNQRQLIGKGDIHIAEAIFGQLAHLSGA
ncbi:hypothetical protein D3C72_1567390 [compost metagenome]